MFGNLTHSVLVLTLALSGCAEPPQSKTPPCSTPLSGSAQPAAPSAPATATAQDGSEATGAAQSAALAWLGLVDQEKYPESWDAAATTFQHAVSRDNWGHAVAGVRGPLGQRLTRQLQSAELKTSLPGVPDGKYVVLEFSSSFEHQATATETVTPMQEADGSWKVAGYFIK